MIMAFAQLHSQSLQSLWLIQPGHAFLNERHHPERLEHMVSIRMEKSPFLNTSEELRHKKAGLKETLHREDYVINVVRVWLVIP